MGGETQEGGQGSTVKRKGSPFLGIEHSGPGPQVTWTPVNSLLCR